VRLKNAFTPHVKSVRAPYSSDIDDGLMYGLGQPWSWVHCVTAAHSPEIGKKEKEFVFMYMVTWVSCCGRKNSGDCFV
jgi:hypothetical protein